MIENEKLDSVLIDLMPLEELLVDPFEKFGLTFNENLEGVLNSLRKKNIRGEDWGGCSPLAQQSPSTTTRSRPLSLAR